MKTKSPLFVPLPHCAACEHVGLSWTPDRRGGWVCPSCHVQNKHAGDQYRDMRRAMARGIRKWKTLDGGETK